MGPQRVPQRHRTVGSFGGQKNRRNTKDERGRDVTPIVTPTDQAVISPKHVVTGIGTPKNKGVTNWHLKKHARDVRGNNNPAFVDRLLDRCDWRCRNGKAVNGPVGYTRDPTVHNLSARCPPSENSRRKGRKPKLWQYETVIERL